MKIIRVVRTIKVGGCYDCPRKFEYQSRQWCENTPQDNDAHQRHVTGYISSRTIHPDCPLDDME